MIHRFPWVLVLWRRLVDRLRLGGSPLEEECGQHHVHAHLEEFAFPVLERRLVKVVAQQIVTERDRLPAVLQLFGVIDPDARKIMPPKKITKRARLTIKSP